MEKLSNLHIDVSAAIDLDRDGANRADRVDRHRRSKKKQRKHRKSCAVNGNLKAKGPTARKSCPHSTFPVDAVTPKSVPSYSPMPSTSNLCDAEYEAFCSSYFAEKSNPINRQRLRPATEWTANLPNRQRQVSIPPPPMKKRLSLELI